MRVILLHGRAAEMDIPSLMEADMAAALWYGLDRISAKVPPKALDVRLAFYGDLWRPDAHQPLPRIEPTEEVQEGFPGLGDISLWVDEHLGVGEALLDRMLRDVDSYFSEPALRAATNARLIDAVTATPADKQGVIVVGFSMGTFVAYDTLRQEADLPVQALITIGSPLGMPSMHRRLVANSPVEPPAPPTPFPAQLGMWVNVWTKDDVATAGHVDLAVRYPSTDPALRVQDVETWGRAATPTNPVGAHNALDYLSSRVFAKALLTAIQMIEADDQ
jgi:pimeloyl-ACP methyl ester carboxylesterase